MVASGRIPAEKMGTHTFTFEQMDDAYDVFKNAASNSGPEGSHHARLSARAPRGPASLTLFTRDVRFAGRFVRLCHSKRVKRRDEEEGPDQRGARVRAARSSPHAGPHAAGARWRG
jgi:hypothetical protein